MSEAIKRPKLDRNWRPTRDELFEEANRFIAEAPDGPAKVIVRHLLVALNDSSDRGPHSY
jgi:hypothetical protein